MSYTKQTSKIRSEITNGYIYVRNLEEKGGVIDASFSNEKQEKKLNAIMQSVTDESFSQVWDMLIGIKGVRFTYKSN